MSQYYPTNRVPVSPLVTASVAVIKHHDQNQLGTKRVHVIFHSTSQSFIERSQSINSSLESGGKNWSRSYEEPWIFTWFSQLTPSTTWTGVALPPKDYTLTSITNQEYDLHTFFQAILKEAFSPPRYLFPDNLILCQVAKKQPEHILNILNVGFTIHW